MPPPNLTLYGDLFVNDSKIESLPENLSVYNLQISSTNISEIPESIKVNGFLYANYTKIRKIPASISSLEGTLSLVGSDIEYLPENISITGDLFLADSAIKYLPEGVQVQGTIYLGGTILSKDSTQKEKVSKRSAAINYDWRP